MHLKFPEKVDNGLRFLKLKLLPKTLFFRTIAAHFHSADCGSGGFHRGFF